MTHEAKAKAMTNKAKAKVLTLSIPLFIINLKLTISKFHNTGGTVKLCAANCIVM